MVTSIASDRLMLSERCAEPAEQRMLSTIDSPVFSSGGGRHIGCLSAWLRMNALDETQKPKRTDTEPCECKLGECRLVINVVESSRVEQKFRHL